MVALVLLLLAAPASAQGYAQRRDALVRDYLAAARERLARARENAEVIQEMYLTPHSYDEAAEAALLHLDLAEAYLTSAETTLARLPDTAPPRGWTPFEERVSSAQAQLSRVAPDLAAAYAGLPVKAGPLEGNTLGEFFPTRREVVLRGYYALAAVPAPYLASLLGHEAQHAVDRSAGRAMDEPAARRAGARVWRALKGGPADDFDGSAENEARAVEGGTKTLEAHLEAAKTRSWEWVTPQVPEPPRPSGAEAEQWEKPEDADLSTGPARWGGPQWVSSHMGAIRANFAQGGLNSLAEARAVLGQVPELAAPFPKIVNYELMEVWALEPRRYPAGLYLAFQALHPVMTELDKARAALSRDGASEEDKEALARTAEARARRRPWPKGSLPSPVATTPVGWGVQEKGLAVVPGAWLDRSTHTGVAAAWLAHLAEHRAQGLAPGAAPTLAQELDAVAAALASWEETGSDARYEKEHPDRLLRFRVAAAEGGGAPGLEAYLGSLGFPETAP